MPETGGAATFVRRAFSDPLGFVAGWVLFLDYLVVISLAALFVPHYLGAVFDWESIQDGPWDAVFGIGVIAFVAAIRLDAAGAALPDRRGGVGAGPARAAAAGGGGAGAGLQPRRPALRHRPGRDAVHRIDRAGALAGDAGLHGHRDDRELRVRGPASRGAPCPAACSSGSGSSWSSTSRSPSWGCRPTRRSRTPRAPTAWPARSGTTWLDAPLAGIAQAIGQEMPWGGDALEVFVGVSNALVLVTILATAMAGGERLAYSMARYDMLPHAFARPEKGARTPTPAATLAAAVIAPVLIVIADAVGDGARFLAGPLQLRRAHRDDRRPARGGAAADPRARPGAAVPRARLGPRRRGRRAGAARSSARSSRSGCGSRRCSPTGARPSPDPCGWRSARSSTCCRGGPAARRCWGARRPPCPDLVEESRGRGGGPRGGADPGAAQARDIGQEVLATAVRLAEDREAEVIVVHVVKVPMSLPLEAEYEEEEHRGLEAIEDAREIAARARRERDRPRGAGAVAGARRSSRRPT